MRSLTPWSWLFIAALASQCMGDSTPPPHFDRYGIILDRKPFGEESVAAAVVDKPVLPPDQSFTAKFKMAAVTRNDNGVIQVGLVDLKSNRSYMLGIGDGIEGVEVVSADYVTERARLRRDPEDYWVSMSGGSNHFEIVGKEVPAVVASPKAAPLPIQGVGTPVAGHPATPRSSYAARRQSREEARIRKELERLQIQESELAKTAKTDKPAASIASVRAGKGRLQKEAPSPVGQALLNLLGQSPEDAEMSTEEVNALLQEYQKELIRSGQTPLPIPLTPETDQALVDEGVLPAQ